MKSIVAEALRLSCILLLLALAQSRLTAAGLTGVDIGGAANGSTTPATTGYDLTSRSSQVGGTADQLHFAYEERTGDFDIQVRVEGVTVTDAFVQAALLARETLDPGARFVGAFATSAEVGCYFESRATASAAAQIATPVVFPVNYPRTYLRLRRAGNVFTGYGSFDGKAWQQLGTTTIALPAVIYFGVGLSSQNTKATATARFRDLKGVTGPTPFTYVPTREPLGPSSRRTGVTFSEIMYHPGPQAGTNDVEFIEIYNGESFFIDLTGWKLSGGIDFSFPDGFQLQSGQFAVIAADPEAIQRVYGYAGALGPYAGRLNNSGDTVKLLNASGAVRLDLKYGTDAPWPVAADGGGHSMVLARPSYGEADPRAWDASQMVGGSPGEVDAFQITPLSSVVINEFLAHTDDPVLDFIELYNASNTSVDISGCILTDDIATNRFRVPAGTVLGPRAFISFDQSQLRFSLSAGGETIYLLSPTADRLLDIVRFAGQENGVSTGRSPDGSPTIRRLSAPTAGAANAPWRIEEVVINEIMYDPLSGDSDDQYVEIFNRSATPVDLSGWKFVDAIEYTFPEGTRIPAGGYFVVAKEKSRLLANYPQLNTNNTFGNFDGKFSSSGEHVALAKRDFTTSTNELGVVLTNKIHITVSEVAYQPGGRWADAAHGGGSSLELIDAHADTLRAANWAASDETAKAPWTTVDFTGRLDLGNLTYAANRFQVVMLGAGECLIDNMEFIPAGSTNIINNGDLEASTNNWRFFGNHRNSAIESTGAFQGRNVLHVRSQGDGDTANNSVRVDMARSVTSGTATIRAKVRWLTGWPEVLLRIRGNWIEYPVRMEVPKNLGTPGLPNSRRTTNIGPAIFDVTHYPPLPRANQSVLVTCRVSDPDGLAQPRVLYRIDPSTSLITLTMRDDGLAGDALTGDGIYSAVIPAQASGKLIAFHIEAADDSPQSASSMFPADAPARECLIRWDDAIPFGNFGHYHMWSTAATETARGTTPDLDNMFRDATVVYGDFRVIYNAGFRDKGSPYHGGSGDFAVTVPLDDLLLGVDDRIFASTGNGSQEGTDMKGDLSGWIGQQLGVPALHSHYMRLYRNGGLYRNDVLYDMEQPNRYFAKSWFDGGGLKDDLFKIAVWFEFDDSNGNGTAAATSATLSRFLSDNQFKLARYRWNWQIRPGNETVNDYTSIFNLANAANTVAERTRTLPLLADMEEWMRVFAYDRLLGNWDSWSYRVGQNMYLYTPLGERAKLIPWDIDFVLGEGDPASTPLFNADEDGVVKALFGVPAYTRALWRAYQDAINGPFVQQNYQPQIDARRAALLKNGLAPTAPTGIPTFMNSRRTYIQTQLRNADTAPFEITSNGGADFASNDSVVSLTGTAPFAVVTIEVNGVPFPVSWITVTTWQITVPLGGLTNVLQITGRDLRGNVVTGANDTIRIAYNGDVPQPQEWVVFNEIMYNPPAPNAAFVELHNTHPTFAFDLSGFKLRGVDFTFPPGSFIQPNGFVVIAEDLASFAYTYGATIPVLGPFSGKLQHGGEALRLVKPAAPGGDETIIDEIRYDNSPPWPQVADGFGPSLQLIDPLQDNWRAGNWGVTATNDVNRATPGRANSTRRTINPFPSLWLNEVQPINTSGPLDDHGEREPWIEMYNAGQTNIDLTGIYLSDDSSQLAKWQFPAGSQISPGQFLLIWADGQPAQSTVLAPHTSFRLNGTNGLVVLSRAQPNGPGVLDYFDYLITTPTNSFGAFPDGDPRKRRMLYVPTPGAPNDATFPGVEVVINEWMAASQSILRDPADGQFEDWFELYNSGTNTVDLSGFYLSDSIGNTTLFQIPPGYQIPPGGFRLIWADSEPAQNAPGADLHVNFSLKTDGEEIALFTPGGDVIDAVAFGPQASNITEGRFPDGPHGARVFFSAPSPGTTNKAEFANQVPVINPIAEAIVDEGHAITFRIGATDSDLPAQTLTYSITNAPQGAAINPQTGDFTWTPTEAQGPGVYTITAMATDNGTPPRSGSRPFKITVREVNDAPSIAPIADVGVDEGSLVEFAVVATDPDLPGQTLRFSLLPGAPAGAQIDPVSGQFQWTPDESQGGAFYPIVVRVTDNGELPRFVDRSFQVAVRKINNPPIIDEIPGQSIDEGTLFSVQVNARDVETPPAKLTYSLETAPTGMVIDAATGLITWRPDEAAGPHDYSIVVRVSEPGGAPSATASFLLGVREVNTPPRLQQPGAVSVSPGQLLLFTNVVSDLDIPSQSLTFSVVGNLPAGAALDQSSGVFSWLIPDDPPIGTNTVTIQVADSGSPPIQDRKSFNIIVHAPLRVAINEIMHRPAVANAEYVELANYSSTTPADLSGWKLEGYDFVFASGTVLAPNGFLCVAPNLAAFQAAYGKTVPVLGNATVSIPSDGGLIRLLRPVGGAADELIDEVSFSLRPPWPAAAATAGASLQLIDPLQDRQRIDNWSATTQTITTNAPQTILPITSQWKYLQNGSFPGATWMQTAFNDSSWPAGGGLFYLEESALPAPKTTPLTRGPMAFYFRTHFTFAGSPTGATLRLNPVIDDGVIFYLNGKEVFRLGMPTGAVDETTAAARTVGNAVFEGPFDLPDDALVSGDNVLAAEVHQANAASSDVVLGAILEAITISPVSYTPGARNSVAQKLDSLGSIWINEILPNNTSGITDNAGDRDPWIELYNAGEAFINLGGWSLTDDPNQLTKWDLPAITVAPHTLVLVWADGEPAESTPTEYHTNFRLAPASGTVSLVARQNNVPVLLDSVTYNANANQSFGSLLDDDPSVRGTLGTPSPLASNTGQLIAPPKASVSWTPLGLRIAWPSNPGRSYRVESCIDLANAQWQMVHQAAGTGTPLEYTDPISTVKAARFYRIVVP